MVSKALAVLMLSVSVHAVANDEFADEIIRLSGVMGMSDQVRQLAEAYRQTLPEGAQQDYLESLVVWSQPSLRQGYESVLAGYSYEVRKQIASLLALPLMSRARRAEEVALLEQDDPAYQAYMQKLRQKPPVSSRVDRINRLAGAMMMPDWLMQAQAAASGPLTDEQSEEIRTTTRHFLLYAYRRLSNPEVEQLIRFWREPVMQRWMRDAMASLP